MRIGPTGYRDKLSGLVIVMMLAGCAQHSAQDSDITQTGAAVDSTRNVDSAQEVDGTQDADRVFDQANTDPRSGLSALDLEHAGLGGHWNTLDENGNGQVSRQEFRKRFQEPAIQRQLQRRAQASSAVTSEQAISSSWRLPPAPPSQGWQRGDRAGSSEDMTSP